MRSYSCDPAVEYVIFLLHGLRLRCSGLVWRDGNGNYWLQTDSWVSLTPAVKGVRAEDLLRMEGNWKSRFFSGKKMVIWKVYLRYKCKHWKVQSLDFMHVALTYHQSPQFFFLFLIDFGSFSASYTPLSCIPFPNESNCIDILPFNKKSQYKENTSVQNSLWNPIG